MNPELAELRRKALAAYEDHSRDMREDPSYRAIASKGVKCRKHDVKKGVCVACGKAAK